MQGGCPWGTKLEEILKSPWEPLTPAQTPKPCRRAPGRSVGSDAGGQGARLARCVHRRPRERGLSDLNLSGLSFPSVTRAGLGLEQIGLVPVYLTTHGVNPALPKFSLGPHILLVPPSPITLGTLRPCRTFLYW